MISLPYYIERDEVKLRLYGKVKLETQAAILADFNEPILAEPDTVLTQDRAFETLDSYTGEAIYETQALTDTLLDNMIAKAEARVERDISPFYVLPLQGLNKESWGELVQASANDRELRYSVEFFKDAFILQACLNVLRNEFGRNSNVNGEAFIENLEKDYEQFREFMYMKNDNGRYIYPPVPKVKTNPYIQYAQDELGVPVPRLCGSRTNNSMRYANTHVDDPQRSWFTAWNAWRYDR